MEKITLYLSTKFFSSALKRAVTLLVFAALLALLAFHDHRIALRLDGLLNGGRPLVELLLLALAIISCTARIIRHVHSSEYLYIKTLPIDGSVRLVTIFSSMAVTCALYLFGLVPLWDVQGWRLCYQFLYTILVIVSISTISAHLILQLAKAAGRSNVLRYSLRSLLLIGVMALIRALFSTNLTEILIVDRGMFAFLHAHLLSANLPLTILCVLWLILYRFADHTYDVMARKRRSASLPTSQRIFKGVLKNLLYKDALIACKKISYMAFSASLIVLGAYLLINQVNRVVHIPLLGIFVFIFSTLSEQLMKDDISHVNFIRTLPIRQSHFFWMKILAVFIILTMPVGAYWVLVSIVSRISIGTFLLTFAGLSLFSFLLCAMHCVVIFANLNTPERMQIELTLASMLSILIPVIPIYYLLIRSKKAKKIFCGGR